MSTNIWARLFFLGKQMKRALKTALFNSSTNFSAAHTPFFSLFWMQILF